MHLPMQKTSFITPNVAQGFKNNPLGNNTRSSVIERRRALLRQNHTSSQQPVVSSVCGETTFTLSHNEHISNLVMNGIGQNFVQFSSCSALVSVIFIKNCPASIRLFLLALKTVGHTFTWIQVGNVRYLLAQRFEEFAMKQKTRTGSPTQITCHLNQLFEKYPNFI